MRVVTIEEHWTTPEIDRALRTQPTAVRDESLALNDVGDISARLFDLGEALAELERTAGVPGQVGIMSYGRSGDRPLDDPANDEVLAAAAPRPADRARALGRDPRLLRQALEYTSVDRILLSGDYPFHRLEAGAIEKFLATLPDRDAQEKVAHANAEALYRLGPNPGEPA